MKQHTSFNHYTVMFFIMILSGLLSTMNMWVDKYDDIRFSINDGYMILLMTGWMFLFMGLFYQEMGIISIGLLLVIVNIWSIRNQFLISETQYKLGMIPHHSMAVTMSKKLQEKIKSINGIKVFSYEFKYDEILKEFYIKRFEYFYEQFTRLNLDATDKKYNIGFLCKKIQQFIPDLVIVENNFKQDFDQRNYRVSNEKLESQGWLPIFSLEDGIQELIKGYQLINKFKNKDFTNL